MEEKMAEHSLDFFPHKVKNFCDVRNTEELIKKGVRVSRNHIIASFAPNLLEYRGVGSGIVRALQAYPAIDFINEEDSERFIVRIKRPGRK